MNVKMVVNQCYGGFGLSLAAMRRLAELGHPQVVALREEVETAPSEMDDSYRTAVHPASIWMEQHRTDPMLVQVVEELGSARETGASGICAKLEVVTVHVDLYVSDNDGKETVSVSGWVD